MKNVYQAEEYSEDENRVEACDHIAVISLSNEEIQCMDCLTKWPKKPDFKSDYPEFDRG